MDTRRPTFDGPILDTRRDGGPSLLTLGPEEILVSANLDREAAVGRARLAKKDTLVFADPEVDAAELSCRSARGPRFNLDGAPSPRMEELPAFTELREGPDLSGELSVSSPNGDRRDADLPDRIRLFFHSGMAEDDAVIDGPKTLPDVFVGDDFGRGNPLIAAFGNEIGTGLGRPAGLLSLSSSIHSSELDLSARLASLDELKVAASSAVERSSSRPAPASSFHLAVFFGVRLFAYPTRRSTPRRGADFIGEATRAARAGEEGGPPARSLRAAGLACKAVTGALPAKLNARAGGPRARAAEAAGIGRPGDMKPN